LKNHQQYKRDALTMLPAWTLAKKKKMEPEQWEHRWEFAVGTLRDITMAEWIYAQWFMKDSNC